MRNVKDIYADAVSGVTTLLQDMFRELEDGEYDLIDQWVHAQCASLEELQDHQFMATQYECNKVRATPQKDLPLLIGHLKYDEAKETLEKRLKSITNSRCPERII